MDTYTLIGFNSFTSKKGSPLTCLHVTYKDNRVEGTACDKIICVPDCISSELYVGAELHISFNRSGFATRVEVM